MKTKLNLEGVVISNIVDNLYFDIFSQSIVDLTGDNKHAHLEFLTRFYHRDGSIINPEEIFSNPENKPILKDLDLKIVEGIFQRIEPIIPHWHYGDNYSFGVNVSETSIIESNKFLDGVETFLEKYSNVSREKIFLEINEKGDKCVAPFVDNAYGRGFNIAADDIGTENFTIGKLRKHVFPNVKDKSRLKVKIDRSFLQKLVSPHNSEREIDEAFIGMMAAVKRCYPSIGIIAEGVEEKETAEYLHSLGIDYAQGFYWGKPQSFDENYRQPRYEK